MGSSPLPKQDLILEGSRRSFDLILKREASVITSNKLLSASYGLERPSGGVILCSQSRLRRPWDQHVAQMLTTAGSPSSLCFDERGTVGLITQTSGTVLCGQWDIQRTSAFRFLPPFISLFVWFTGLPPAPALPRLHSSKIDIRPRSRTRVYVGKFAVCSRSNDGAHTHGSYRC